MAKHWPESEIYGDIRGITTDSKPGHDELKNQEVRTGRPTFVNGDINLLTGGFPCQPFSAAGKRRGTSDDRHLWPEMFRVIQLTKPTWIIGENVPGIINIEGGMVFEQICLELENEGYEVQPFIIPAVSVNAPHRRDRVWIVAHRQGGRKWSSQPEGNNTGQSKETIRDRNRDAWEQDWLEVATRLCRMDDGVSSRVDRLKSLGNAIVPQVAIQIMNAIKESYE